MKKLSYLILFISPLLFAASACNKLKDFGDTNVNPGGVTAPSLAALLTNVEAGIGAYAALTTPGLFSQYFSQTQYTDQSLYALPQIDFNASTYAGYLMDLQDIINRDGSNNQSTVAKILQQYLFWTVTDRWGDVPYSEALKGNPTPKYDKQEDIYKGVIASLAAAVGQFDNSSIITGDIIYGGNAASWKRLANSLRMLMALQLSKRFPGPNDYAATAFKAALNDPAGYIATNEQSFTLRYPGGNYRNEWYNAYNGRKDFGQSNSMTALMASLNDNRQNVFGGKTDLSSPAPGWNQPSSKGVPYGWTKGKTEAWTGANPDWARILRSDYREETDPLVIIGAAHVALARAEAADRGWTSENLSSVFRQGVTLSFEQWGLNAPAASYFSQSGVILSAPAGTGANIEPIAIQRYIAFYPDGLQGWNIWRKTGFPVLIPAADATNSSKQIPRRYVYGQSEYASNKVATEAAAQAIPGGDKQDSRVWWDQ